MLVFFNGFVNICDWYALEFFAQRQIWRKRWPERVGHLGSLRIWGQTRSDTVTDALLKLCLEGMLKVTQLLVMIDDASEVTMGKHYDWSSRSRLSSDMQFPKSFPHSFSLVQTNAQVTFQTMTSRCPNCWPPALGGRWSLDQRSDEWEHLALGGQRSSLQQMQAACMFYAFRAR